MCIRDSQYSENFVKGQGRRGQTNVEKLLFLSSYLYNSKSYYPILMSFGRMVNNDKSKTKMGSQENWSKVKVTGQGQRGQITIKKDCF